MDSFARDVSCNDLVDSIPLACDVSSWHALVLGRLEVRFHWLVFGRYVSTGPDISNMEGREWPRV